MSFQHTGNVEHFVKWHTQAFKSPRIFARHRSGLIHDLQRKLQKENRWRANVADWVVDSIGLELPEPEGFTLFIHVLWVESCGQSNDAREILRKAQDDFLIVPPPKNTMAIADPDSDDEDDLLDTHGELPTGTTTVSEKLAHSTDLRMCQQWTEGLRLFFGRDLSTKERNFSSTECVDILQEMRKIKPSHWKPESWVTCVRESGLASMLEYVCAPDTDLELAMPHISQSFRYHCWKETFGEILEKWTPPNGFKGPNKHEVHDLPQTPYSAAKFLLSLAHDGKCIIPTASNPSSVFFLMNLRNFSLAWDNWLRPTLLFYHINASSWDITQIYREIRGISDIVKFESSKKILIHPRVKLLLKLTSALKQEGSMVNQYAHQNHRTKRSSSQISPIKAQHVSKRQKKVTQLSYTPLAAPGLLAHSPVSPLTGHDSSLEISGSLPPSMALTTSMSSADDSLLNSNTPDLLRGISGIPSSLQASMPASMPDVAQLTCNTCKGLKPDQKCVWSVTVTRQPVDHLVGSALTCADGKDYLPPMAKKTSDGTWVVPSVSYCSPMDLGLREIAHRPDVLDRCGRDKVLFFEKEKNELIGGVQFKPCSSKTFGHLKAHHQSVNKFRPLKRGGSFEAWKYGEMKALGSRLAQGGRRGDAYALYAGIGADTDEEITALFGHAQAADILMEMGSAIYPGVDKLLGIEQHANGINPLGSTGANIFVCTNYISPQHRDKDMAMSVCMQLDKTCQDDEFNFAYTEWGVYIKTIPNCLWLFYSHHLHGTIMPRLQANDNGDSGQIVLGGQQSAPNHSRQQRSGGQQGDNSHAPVNLNLRRSARIAALANPAATVSTGIHVTTRARDAQRAQQYQIVRAHYNRRSAYWS